VVLERGPLSLVSTTEELLDRSVTLTTWHPLSAKVGNQFADKRRSLCRYSSFADSDHGKYSSERIRFTFLLNKGVLSPGTSSRRFFRGYADDSNENLQVSCSPCEPQTTDCGAGMLSTAVHVLASSDSLTRHLPLTSGRS
jgi:hypothetical protein